MKEPNSLGVAEDRGTSTVRRLRRGIGRTEPGIYRFTAGERLTETGIRMVPLADPDD